LLADRDILKPLDVLTHLAAEIAAACDLNIIVPARDGIPISEKAVRNSAVGALGGFVEMSNAEKTVSV